MVQRYLSTEVDGRFHDPEIFRSLLRYSTDLVAILDSDGTVRYASPSYHGTLGLEPGEIEGKSAFAGIHRDDLQAVRAAFMATLREDGTPVSVQYRCRHADGSWRTLESVATGHLDDPVISGVIVNGRDITERVLAEEALRQREIEYRAIFEATSDGLIIASMDGRLVEVNPAMCRMHGYSREELLHLFPTEFIHPDYHSVFADYMATLNRGVTYRTEAIDIRKDGSAFPVEVNGTTFLYRGRLHVLGVVRDVTERAEAQERLREREVQYREVFQATTDALVITDLDGIVVEANAAACRMHGYGYEEFIGLDARTFIHPDSHEGLAACLQAIRGGESYGAQARAVRKDGCTLYVEVRGSSFLYRGAPHALAVVRDVTERVQAYELLEQRVTERTRELSMLLNLSHEAASTLQLKPLLGLMLDALRGIVEFDSASLLMREDGWLVDFDHHGPGSLGELVRLGIFPEPRIPIDAYQPGWEIYLSGKAVIIDDVAADTEIAAAFRAGVGSHVDELLALIRNWMGVPLIVKDNIVGLLVLSSRQPGYFTQQHARLALAVASQAAVAVENARLYERVQEAAALQERQRLARELHDSVSQALYGIGMGAQTTRVLLQRDPKRAEQSNDYVLSLAEAGLAEMRALIFELRPESLQSEGLAAALEKQVTALRARYQMAIGLTLCDEPPASLSVKEALYRIAQEALHNTVKHARATESSLLLEVQDGSLVLEVWDNGAGFDAHGSFPGHLGLQSMRERAARLGGSLEIESSPGTGTLIRARIPATSGR